MWFPLSAIFSASPAFIIAGAGAAGFSSTSQKNLPPGKDGGGPGDNPPLYGLGSVS
jgi:hypothetical protein